MKFTLNVNGESRSVDADAKTPLLWVLRDELELKGTKFGCGMSLCGACTVHVDGAPIRACMTPVSTVGQARITTIEGVGATPVGAKVQAAWLDVDVVQCGYCQAGQIMSATALLTQSPSRRRPSTIGRAGLVNNPCAKRSKAHSSSAWGKLRTKRANGFSSRPFRCRSSAVAESLLARQAR